MTMIYIGGDLALGPQSNKVLMSVSVNGRIKTFTLEEALRNIEQFDPRHQRQIVDCLPYQYQMPGSPDWMWRVEQPEEEECHA